MNTHNIVYAKMICPLCQQNVDTEIKITIGDSRQIHQYTIGDRIVWRRHASVQNGGRPGNGNIDADGFFFSDVCGDRALVKVVIRGDMIRDVFFDQDDDTLSPAHIHQAAQAMQIPSIPPMPNLPKQGKVTFDFDAEWLTSQRKEILSRLIEAGVDIYAPTENAKNLHFRIMVPHGLHPATYIEIAYLMSQLVEVNFPEPLVEYVESYPHGVKYRVKNTGSALDIHFDSRAQEA